jgi:hypothetical protein
MEEPSEQKREDLDDMSMSMEKELLLKESSPDSGEQLHKKPIVVQEELLDLNADNCQKCQTSKIDKMYIAGHDVLHCICTQCGYEWVE